MTVRRSAIASIPELPVVVLSPHLDDGVMSCGALLADRPGSTVVTVFAGTPRSAPLTDWDERCAFAPGDDVIGARRAEDAAACARVEARPRWLEFCRAQYAPSPSVEELAPALAEALGDVPAAPVVAPLGLFHSDHVMVGDAARRVARADPARPWFLYVDAIYRAIAGLTGARLDECLHDGARLRLAIETPSETARAAKRDAVAEYRSQQRVLGGRIVDAFAGEQFLAVGDR